MVELETPQELLGNIFSSGQVVGGMLGQVGPRGPQGIPGPAGASGNDGRGIVSIIRTSGNGASGTTDIYTITYTDGTTSDFSVYNGADGQGVGNMLKAIYDVNNNGIVDNAEKVNNHTVNTDVPSSAEFTDENAKWGNITGNLSQQNDLSEALGTKADASTLAEVATSGSYEDLSHKPTIPVVPTNISAFTNDEGYLTQHQDISGKEDKSNKTVTLSESSTNTEYPGAKAVYDAIPNVIDNLESTSTTEALSAKQGKVLDEKIDDIIGNIGSISCAGTDVVETTTEVDLGSGTITKAGKYLIVASIPINYYGQDGRQLILRLKINEQEVWSGGGVINSYVYTLYTQLAKIVNIPANTNVKVTLSDLTGKTFACSPFTLEYIRLK